MTRPAEAVNPEPRWPVFMALLSVGGISFSLPHSLVLGPRWLLLAIVAVLLIPAALAHRTGNHGLDAIVGYTISVVITLALVASLALLIETIPARSETPLSLLGSAAALWLTNVLVFAIWYWRLDAGGPHRRETRPKHTSGAFFFPQMMEGAPIGHPERWSPHFVDYLFLAFNQSTAFSPTDTPVLTRWAKVLSMTQAVISLLIVAILASRAVGLL